MIDFEKTRGVSPPAPPSPRGVSPSPPPSPRGDGYLTGLDSTIDLLSALPLPAALE